MENSVDILLTTYNTNIQYLKIQIDSILNQTFKDFSLIISDDCSPNEEVREVLKEYAQKDSRVKLFFQKDNLGYTKNFEFVLSKSTADYIAFSDHDDVWYPNKIEESLKILKEKNVDLVYCDANQIDENGNILHESYLRYKDMPIIKEKYNNKKQKNEVLLAFSRHIAIGCSQLFTKAVKEMMLPFSGNTMAHDWNSVYIATRLNGVFCVDKPLFGYRLHGSNAFGGRSFKQNMNIWKEKNGNNYNSYLQYRKHVITETYMAGALMCEEYSKRIASNVEIEKQQKKILDYYRNAQDSKIIYWDFYRYFKYLYFKGIGRKSIKELMIFHFPILSYLVYKIS